MINKILLTLVVCIAIGGMFYLGTQKSFKQQPANTVPSPYYQITTTPTPTVPVAKLTSLKDKIIYVDNPYSNNSVVWASGIDGSNPTRLVDSKNRIAFDGWSDGGRVFYYSELIGTIATVYKKDFSSGIVTKLFSFDSSEKNIETFSYNVSVTSDGTYAVYSHNHGDISLYDLINNVDKPLLHQIACTSYNPSGKFDIVQNTYAAGGLDCHGYFYPSWSPDNKKVVVRKIFYEGATNVIINPFTNPIEEKDVKTGGSPISWSKDNTTLVIPGSGYGPGSLYLITNLNSPIKKDVLAENNSFKDNSVSSAAVSNNGIIAFTYSTYQESKSNIALYTIHDGTVKTLNPTTVNYSIEKWLDNQTIILKDDNKNFWTLDINNQSLNKLPIRGDTITAIIQ